MKLVVGLGNPGAAYEQTKHNIGFNVLDAWVAAHGGSWTSSKSRALVATVHIDGQKVIAAKPLTFMNLSGEAVRALADYYQVAVADILIVFDDMDLALGTLRLRQKGSAGGHNGIKSIIQYLGTSTFPRLKVGIGRPFEFETVVQHVLSPFLKVYQQDVQQMIDGSCRILDAWARTSVFTDLMNQFNGEGRTLNDKA